ncbi:hypothetical protein, partial [Lentilactobacillus hilgardii]
MKKSRIVLVTLLTSLGLAVAIGVQNSHFIGNQLNTGIVAKADVVNSSITSRRGGTTPISTPWESDSKVPRISQYFYLSTPDGKEKSLYGLVNQLSVDPEKKDRAAVDISKNTKDLLINADLTNPTEQPIKISYAIKFAGNSTDGPVLTIGKSTSNDQLLSAKALGGDPQWDTLPNNSGVTVTEATVGATSVDYKPVSAQYSIADQNKVTGIMFSQVMLQPGTTHIKIPVKVTNLANAGSSATQREGLITNALYNYYYGTDHGTSTGSEFSVGVFDKNVGASDATINTGTPVSASTFKADPADTTTITMLLRQVLVLK